MEWKFSHITHTRGLGKYNPTRLNLRTGHLLINDDIWNRMSKDEKREALSHEEGHYVLQTTNEFAADNYSLKRQVALGYSPEKARRSMEEILNPRNPQHRERMQARRESAIRMQQDLTARNSGNRSVNYGGKAPVIAIRYATDPGEWSYEYIKEDGTPATVAEKKKFFWIGVAVVVVIIVALIFFLTHKKS